MTEPESTEITEATETTGSPDTVEFLPPAMSTTWKVAMVTVAVSAVMAFIAIFQTLYSFLLQGAQSSGTSPDPVVVTLWKISVPGGISEALGPPAYKYPLLFGAVALLASAVVLIVSVERQRLRAVGRTLTLASTAFFVGVAWMVCVDIDQARRQYTRLDAGDAQVTVVFTVGDAVWFSVIAGVLAIASSVLVLTRAMSPPRAAGPMVYQIVPDEEPEPQVDEKT
jgi:hypothetical protein